MIMDWSKLYFGKVKRDEIQRAVNDSHWQTLRRELKGKSLEVKYKMLMSYYESETRACKSCADERLLEVRLTNYVTALSRGGLIKVGDYKNCD